VKQTAAGFDSTSGTAKPARAPEGLDVRVVIRVNGRPVRIETRVPRGSVRLDELLPALRKIDDRLIDAVIAGVEAKSERVSCAKGCSACCRTQPVPITPPEALALKLLIETLPEPRRTAVRSAFAIAVERLRGADLYESYMRRDKALTRESARTLARRYLALGIACPFLEHDACSIYPDRPFVCRQYFVTSPPELCKAPLDNSVRPVSMPAGFATAMLATTEAISGRPQYTVPLVLALEYVGANGAELERTYTAQTAFGHVMRRLACQT
jgi:Fe-S-cluster containining protein